MLLGGSAASVCLGFWLTTTAVTIPAVATTSMAPATSHRGRSLGRRRRRGGAGAGRACDSGLARQLPPPGVATVDSRPGPGREPPPADETSAVVGWDRREARRQAGGAAGRMPPRLRTDDRTGKGATIRWPCRRSLSGSLATSSLSWPRTEV
jgi:hypothetical protein